MQENNYGHNFVIFGSSGFYEVAYNDIIGREDVCYFNYREKKFRTSRLVKGCLQWASLNRNCSFLHLIFSLILYPWLFPIHFKKSKPLIFLFFNGWEIYFQSSYLQYLNDKYPSAKFVLYLQDIVAKQHKRFDMKKAQKNFDLLISYDKGDCEKYGAKYHPTPYSAFNIDQEKNSNEHSDVYFCGKAKKRLDIIFDAFEQLTEMGLKCDFILIDVPESKRVLADGIQYMSEFPYTENLNHVATTRCILEIMQQDADGFTPRLWESIMYDKHLLTNNTMLSSSQYYRPEGMHQLSDIGNAPVWIMKTPHYESSLKKNISPLSLLHFIEDHLN